MEAIQPRYLLGRCANACEADKGVCVHAVPARSIRALCGATYGQRSAGWGGELDAGLQVTCPRCLKRLQSN